MSREIYRRSVGPHLDRIRYDGGTETRDVQTLIALQRYYEERKDSIKLFYFPALTGNKIRVSGANNYISKGYDISPNANDATQSTAVNQPYLSGNIAPNEKLCAKNTNGGSCYLINSNVIYGTSDFWTVSTVIRLFTFGTTQTLFTGGTYSKIRLTTAGKIEFVNESNTTVTGTFLYHKFLGKNTIFHLVANNGTISIYANGTLTETISIASNFTFSQQNSTTNPFYGCTYQYANRYQALTPTEVAAEYNLLRSYIPEIESVQIGTQTWATSNYEAVCTPQGTLIPEVQDNGNVENISNGNFGGAFINGVAVGWDWNYVVGTASQIVSYNSTNGQQITNRAGNSGIMACPMFSSKLGWYKYSFWAKNNGGSGGVTGGSHGFIPTVTINNSSWTQYTGYFYSNQVANCWITFVANSNAVADTNIIAFDDVSIQKIGWSGSQELYNNIYRQTAEAASAVEKIINGTLEGTYVNGVAPNLWNIIVGTASEAVSYDGSKAQRITNPSNTRGTIACNIFYPSLKWYKYSFWAKNDGGTGGTVTDNYGLVNTINITSASWTNYTGYFKSETIQAYALSFNANPDINVDANAIIFDNVSIKELGLSDTTNIENYTYVGVKAAAMWCHYNNDVAVGAIYGKLYNWFAVKLLQMDIDYYNAANPTTPWGWRVPTQADFTTLSTYLGGDSISGGKMKLAGTTYWSSPNTGADNSSGLSLIGAGGRRPNGNFDNYNWAAMMVCIDSSNYTFTRRVSTDSNSSILTLYDFLPCGTPIRLIKS